MTAAWRRRTAALVLACAVLGTGCDRTDTGSATVQPTTTSTAPVAPAPAPGGPEDQAVAVAVDPDRPRGGSARVGVWAVPDPASPTLGGAAVRALVLPQLFVARPDGRWSPSLVEPRTDVTGPDARSASFRIRVGAAWSDGTPITVDDLRRTADPRFVAGVDTDGDGLVTVRFTSPLPGWRRLWSGQDSIGPPTAGLWGGPFVVAAATPGLETVLTRNERWPGPGPFLDEVRLVLVPDATIARQLLERGDLDVVMPPAGTARSRQLAAITGVETDRVEGGGWSVVLLTNSGALTVDQRRALFASLDRPAFVSTLLHQEATLLQGFAGPEDATWSAAAPGDVAALGDEAVDLVGTVEEPMTGLVHRSMQKRVRAGTGGDATIELRAAEADRVERWVGESDYEAALVPWLDPPGGCWTCRFPDLAAAAGAADAGDPAAILAIETTLRDEARVLPLWRPATVAAWRSGLRGVQANGYAASGAWNAWEWWRADIGGG